MFPLGGKVLSEVLRSQSYSPWNLGDWRRPAEVQRRLTYPEGSPGQLTGASRVTKTDAVTHAAPVARGEKETSLALGEGPPEPLDAIWGAPAPQKRGEEGGGEVESVRGSVHRQDCFWEGSQILIPALAKPLPLPTHLPIAGATDQRRLRGHPAAPTRSPPPLP